MNIFNTLPDNFFNVLTGSNKRIISDCIFLLHLKMNTNISYTLSKEESLLILEDYFLGHIIKIEEIEAKNPHENSLYVLKRLRESGWISEEIGQNYQVIISFNEYSLNIINGLNNLKSSTDIEYAGYVYTISQLLSNFQINKGDYIVEQVYENTKILINKLKSLNSNIKKYIQKLLDKEYKDDLNSLLSLLLTEYQTKIIDRAYYNLTTYDHPAKYRTNIIKNIQNIIDQENVVETISYKTSEAKDVSLQEAKEIIHDKLNYVIDSFESLDDILEQIDDKNSKYIDSAISRINFLLNTNKDLDGKINSIIKAISKSQDINKFINISEIQNIDKNSLYKKRAVNVFKENLLEDYEIDVNKLIAKSNSYLEQNIYAKKNVNEYVIKLFKNKQHILASNIEILDDKDFVMLVLIYLYGLGNTMSYEISLLEQVINVNGYRFKDFKIGRIDG